MQNKLERKETNRRHTQHKMLWVGMFVEEKVPREHSYRTKAKAQVKERDRLKLERDEWKYAK
jgi:hypothetical protein